MATLTVGLGGTYSTIQAAVDAAGNGDTIEIAAGTYREQVTVDGKNITIHGAGSGQTIIEAPDAASLVSNASDSNAPRQTKYAVVTVKGDADVTIAGVTVDGRDQASIPNPPTNYDFMAIYVLNSDAHIDGVVAKGADELAGADVSGIQRNHAILATSHDAAHGGTGAHTVEIENSTVSGFQKTGIFVNGSTLTANIHDNTIVGTHTANTAQNGIQVGSLFGVVGDGDFSGTHATIDHNTITDIGNSGPAGSASGIIVFSGDASTVSITNNTLTGWAAPQANGNSGITFVDSNGGAVTGNTISGFDAGLNVLDQFGGTLHTPVSHSGNIYNNDVVNIALEPNPAGTTGLTFSGSEGHDELTGNAGADTLSGLGGNDAIVGGSGTDTAAYTATISTSGITDDGAGHFVVATGGSEGTDTLSGVEKIDGAGSHNILLVGNGGYATIQAAVNAAADGDTIEIAAGTYTEDVTITGKALTIDGVENGSANSVTLNGQVTVAGTLNGAFAITDLNINATGKDYGVRVTANSTAFAGSVTLDDVSISNAKQDGFAYIRVGNESIPRLGDTIGAVSILNSQFHNNATASSPASGRADILLFGYNQDLTITNVVIDTPGAFAQKAIQMRGIEDVGNVVNVGPYHQAGDVAINNLTITGAYGQDVMAFYRIAGFDSFTGANNSVNVTRSVNASSNATLEPWAVINMDEVGGSIDLSSFFSSASNLASANGGPGVPSWIATLQGLGGNEIFIGTSGTDTLVGRGGNDILNGGAGADAMQGGAGNDTYLVDNAGDVVTENASEGTDLVQSSVSFTLGTNVDNLTLTGSGNINGTGNGDANVITGNSGNNTLDGGVGADTLTGGDGNDTYVVDNAGDVVTEAATVGSGTDTVQSSISYTLGANVENLTLTGSGNINGTGNGDANVITGNTGNNILIGGGGNDTLVGGAGTDTASYTGTLTAANITAVADVDRSTPGNQPGWQVVASGGQGTDILTGVEKVTDGTGHSFLLVGSGGFATIQEAINAAASGDTIIVAPGTWTLPGGDSGKELTFLGANAGIGANGVRGPETIIDGGVTPANFRFESGGGTFDGFTIKAQHFDSYVLGADIALLNNIITNPGTSVLYTLGGPNSVTLTNNSITGVTSSGGSLDAVFIAGNWNGTTGTQVSISGNVFTGSPGLSGFNLSSVHGTIANNTIDGLSYYGFLLANNTNVDVTGNTFANIVNPDPTVGSWGAGVRTYTPGPFFGLDLDGNTFTNNAVGLGIRAGSDVAPGVITITNNVFNGASQNSHRQPGLDHDRCDAERHQQLQLGAAVRRDRRPASGAGRPRPGCRGQCQLRLGRAQGRSRLSHGE